MTLTRREFGRLAVSSSACGVLLRAAAGLQASPDARVAFQPFAAHVTRLLTALDALGTPFPPQDTASLRRALRSSREGEEEAWRSMLAILDRHTLLEVTLNPEMRLSIRRGDAPAELDQSGWRTFLIKVINQAGTTPVLKVKSPQGAAVGRRSSLAITGVHDFTNGATDEVEARGRWLGVSTYDAPPLTPALSGLGLEYRILQLYSRDEGQREASLQADVGYGEQDLGYRSSLPILFHCRPARTVRLQILDENGQPSIASLLVTDRLGRVYPSQSKRAMPDLGFQPQIYRYNGEHILLPDGPYTVEFSRGPEYLSQRLPLQVTGASREPLRLRLERWISPAAYGYYSGDTHIHAAGCSHYESPTEGVVPLVMERQVDGEALDLGSVLNWGPGFEYQKQFFTGRAEPMHHAGHADSPMLEEGMPHDAKAIAARQEAEIAHSLQHTAEAPDVKSLVRYDIEVSGFPSSHCGHLVLLRLHDQRFPKANSIDDWPSWNAPIMRWAKAQGGVVGYAHSAHGLVVDSTALPNLVMPPFNSMGANEFIANVTHEGLVDFISGCDLWPFAELNIWYHTLNCGYMTPFVGETDFPCITDACVGGGRSYVPLAASAQGEDGYTRWLEALLHQSSYFGDGRSHLFDLKVNRLPRSPHPVQLSSASSVEVSAQVCARLEPEPNAITRNIQQTSAYDKPYWHVERARLGQSRKVPIELIVNGIALGRTEIVADGQVRPVSFRTNIDRSSWVALRIYPSSHTNPVFVTVSGKPVRASRASAVWCRKAVDVCWAQKRLRIRPEELAGAAEHYEQARLSYDRIVRESPA